MASPLPNRIPEVSFARIMVVARDAQTGAAWPRLSSPFDSGTAINDGMFLHRNSAPGKTLGHWHLKILLRNMSLALGKFILVARAFLA
jgi:hypothetical protein